MEVKWKDSFITLKKAIDQAIPSGFEIEMQYGMPSYVIPLAIYPDGYHCKKDTPLPFISILAQKNHIAVYLMGIYAAPQLLEWFQKEYPNHMATKLNIGKSCI